MIRKIIKEEEALTDDSVMPFGKYKGKRLSEIPATYLHWFYCNGDVNSPVFRYIEGCKQALKDEAPDLIWRR
jgi:uncharacterized protein (DUF3820 family)